MMPILFTIIGLCIGMKFGKALKSGLYVGVGFVGLGIVTALLTNGLIIRSIYYLSENIGISLFTYISLFYYFDISLSRCL